MPVTKRPLADTDGNASIAQPEPKRQSTGEAKENQTPEVLYSSLKKDELVTLLRQPSLPVSGQKADLIKRLTDNDAPNTAALVPDTSSHNTSTQVR